MKENFDKLLNNKLVLLLTSNSHLNNMYDKSLHLVLEDGTVFQEKSFGHEVPLAGKVVFRSGYFCKYFFRKLTGVYPVFFLNIR